MQTESFDTMNKTLKDEEKYEQSLIKSCIRWIILVAVIMAVAMFFWIRSAFDGSSPTIWMIAFIAGLMSIFYSYTSILERKRRAWHIRKDIWKLEEKYTAELKEDTQEQS